MEIKYMSRQEVAEKLDMKTCISLMENVFMGFAKGEIKNILRSVGTFARWGSGSYARRNTKG